MRRDPVLDGHARILRGAHVLQAVLVAAGLEPDIESLAPVVPRHRVRDHQFLGETQVRRRVDVGNGCRDVKGLVFHRLGLVGIRHKKARAVARTARALRMYDLSRLGLKCQGRGAPCAEWRKACTW